jgi:KDO2-lipid IV(A) lauroyltransferase
MKHIAKLKFLPFYTLSIMPLFVLYRVSDLVYIVLYYLIRYRRDVVSDNLKYSFPLKSEQEIKIIEKKIYSHFCDIWFEAIKVLTISKKAIKKRFHIKDL